MRVTLPLLLCTALAVSACSRVADSRLNPLNWFGASTVSAPRDAGGNIRPLVTPEAFDRVVDTRTLVSSILSLEIARTPNGGIVTAKGIAPTGAFNAQLVPVSQDGATLTLAFRVENGANVNGSQTITAARFIDTQALESVRRVVVQAQQNTASSTR